MTRKGRKKAAETEKGKASFHTALHYLQAGRLNAAEDQCRRLLKINPGDADLLQLAGLITREKGELEKAAFLFSEAISSAPDNPFLHDHLGVVHQMEKRFPEAESCFRHALTLKPNAALIQTHLGNCLQVEGRYSEAVRAYADAIEADSGCVQALCGLGNALRLTGNTTDAVDILKEAIRLQPEAADAHHNLALALKAAGAVEEALVYFKNAVAFAPANAMMHFNLGEYFSSTGNHIVAIESYRHAIALAPSWIAPLLNIGTAYRWQGEIFKAIDCFQEVLERDPQSASALNNLGNVYKDLGDIEQAVSCFTWALTENPDRPSTRSNILLTRHYRVVDSPDDLFEAHREWERIHCSAAGIRPPSYSRSIDPDRPIRVGYVSADFHKHSVSFFMEPIFSAHRLPQVEVFAYSDNLYEDDTTRRLKAHVANWRNVSGMSDAKLTNLIHADGIDILVDLAGHTAHNRLSVFACKPAPVQVTYLGYPDTTGLSAIDYRITDAASDPPGVSEMFYTEKLERLPSGFLCYRPSPDAPLAAKQTSGPVIFASFNYSGKISPEVICTWSEILRRVPDSRLWLKAAVFADNAVKRSFVRRFESCGVTADRIVFRERVPAMSAHLALYNEVDIALDTFPYNGTTTTCEALWMGTPVVTVTGNIHAARVGTSILRQVGLTSLVSKDVAGYIETAISLARDREGLRSLQNDLRGKMASSPLMDESAFVSDLEAAYRGMWRRWCRERVATGISLKQEDDTGMHYPQSARTDITGAV